MTKKFILSDPTSLTGKYIRRELVDRGWQLEDTPAPVISGGSGLFIANSSDLKKNLNLVDSFRYTDYCFPNTSNLVVLSSSKIYEDAPVVDSTATRCITKKLISEFNNLSPIYKDSEYQSHLKILEKYISDQDVENVAIFRLGCISGYDLDEAPGFLPEMIRCIRDNTNFTLYDYYDGKQVRDYLHYKDLVLAIEKVTKIKRPYYSIVNIGGGLANSISLMELYGYLQFVVGTPIKFTQSSLFNHESYKAKAHYISDITKAKDLLKWHPKISVEMIIREYLIKEGLI